MHCDEFRDNWTAWHEGWLDLGEGAMRTHREACPACRRYDGQMRRMLAELAALPPARPVRPRRRGLPRWAGLAATLVLGVALGLLIAAPFGGDAPATLEAETVAFDGPGVHRVAVAFDSPRRLGTVEFVVELPPGAELVGFPDRRRVRWQGELAAGRSRLQLPVRIAPDAELGPLVTRVVHRTGERRLVVPLRLKAGGEGDDPI